MNPLKFTHTLNETEPEMARREYITRNVLFFTFVVTFSFGVMSFILYLFGKMPLDTLIIYSLVSIVLIAAMFFAQKGFWRVVGVIPPLLMYFPAVRANYIGGIDAPGNFMYALLIMFVAIIYGHRKMWIALAICIATYLCLVWMISIGYIKPYRTADVVFINRVVLISGFLVGIALMIWLLGRSYRSEVDVRIKDEELLNKKNQELSTLNDVLRSSEEKYRFMTEHSSDVIWHLDGNYCFNYVSPADEIMRGFKQKEVIGTTVWSLLKPEGIEHVKRMNAQRLADEQNGIRTGTISYELEQICKDGSWIWTEVNVTAYHNQNGKLIGLHGVTRNIAERKRVEEEKCLLEERLQRAEKMEALGTLAGGVAHDLNNVLGVIVGYSELLLNEVDKSNSFRPRLEKIMGGSEKAAAIVQDLLTLARRGVSGRQVLNLNKIILDYQNSPESEKLSSYHSSVRINLDLEPNLLNISGSSVHLNKTLFNLIANAAEAMPKGGILIIKTANQYLDKPIKGYEEVREGDYVVLSVTDTGEGIPAGDIQRIFEPFYTKKVMGRSGTGLGLAVIWGTVKDHQGYINVQSKEGKGSTFTLYFPVTREEISAEAASISVSEYIGKGETILVVDDVREQRELAADMLKKLNYQVATVTSGEDAIAYLKEHKVNLLVLDMIMYPGIDGLDTYKNILKINPEQKAIIVSGFSESERVKDAQKLGAGAYVKKPYIMENIGMAVRKELDKK